jgi:hypothetical protein
MANDVIGAPTDMPHSRVEPRGYAEIPQPRTPAEAPFKKSHETDDACPVIVTVDNIRVINCRDDMQWIVQRRGGGKASVYRALGGP